MTGYAIWGMGANPPGSCLWHLSEGPVALRGISVLNVGNAVAAECAGSPMTKYACSMSEPELQATDIYALLAAELSTEGDLHALLRRLLEPIARLTGARAGTVSVKAPEGDRLRQIGVFERSPPGAGDERIVVMPLTYRSRALGSYRLWLAADAVIGGDTASFHRTLGALLGLALRDAERECESRRALVADVHDGIAQTLVFARMRLPLLEEAIATHDESSALRYCADLRQAVGTAHTNLRAILSQGGVPMDPKGLKHALSSSIRSFHDLTQVDLVFDDRAPELRLAANQESQVYLIVQEALANIAKHAGAHHAWLQIDQQGDRVDIVVEDDGAGLPTPARPPSTSHLGMDIMRQRAASLGGGVEIAARDGGGTRMRLSFPTSTPACATA